MELQSLLYWSDHAPPHFHAKYGDYEASVDIKSGKILQGALSKRAAKLVEDWRRLHEEELIADWNLPMERKPLRAIDPLE